jgi:branched-chain amino acid aminotransferase
MMDENDYPRFLWFNGEIVPWDSATLHATHTIWSGINTVFEGVRAYWNPYTETMHIFRLTEHLRRLKQSLRLIRLDMPYDLSALLEHLPALLLRNEIREDTYIRIVVFPSERRMASRADEEVVNLVMDTAPHPSHLDEDQMRRLMVSSYTRISDAVMSPQIKSIANYRNSDIALQEARLAGYDGPIFLNRHGEVAEGAWSCLFLVRNGILITPDLQSDILESVTRDTMIRLAGEQLGLKVEQRRVGRTELYLADEAFLCGTAAEIQPIGSIDGFTLGGGAVGDVTGRLRTAYAGVIRGEDDSYPDWRTSVRVGTTHSV